MKPNRKEATRTRTDSYELSRRDTNRKYHSGDLGTVFTYGERHVQGGRDRKAEDLGPGCSILLEQQQLRAGASAPPYGDGVSLPPSLPRRPSIRALLRTQATNCLRVYSPTCGPAATVLDEFSGLLLVSLQSASMGVVSCAGVLLNSGTAPGLAAPLFLSGDAR
jgi:hypothetical protein